jgi:Spy/CpxP family protein refolding chaperone
MLRRLDSRVKKLELTEAQTRRYEEIRTRFKKDLLNDLSRFKNARTSISAQIMMDDPDIPAIAEELKQRIAGSPDLRAKYLDYFVEFYNILDEDQKQKVLNHINRRLKHFERVHS